MKKILLILMAMFAFGIQNVSAQDAIKIVTNHPDFKIKVKRCIASGNIVFLDLILNNLGTNDIEGISAGAWETEIYDDEGNIYSGEHIKVKVANSKDFESYWAKFNIPTGVPITLNYKINNVSNSSENFTRIKIPFICSAWGLVSENPIRISNIPITRD